QGLQLGNQPPLLVEELLRLVAAQPILQHLQMRWLGGNIRHGDLVRPPATLEVLPVHFPRSGPALGAAQDDHRPTRPDSLPGPARLVLDLPDLEDTVLQRGSDGLVHALWVAALYKVRRVPVTNEHRSQLFVADATEASGALDVVTIEVQDRKYSPI